MQIIHMNIGIKNYYKMTLVVSLSLACFSLFSMQLEPTIHLYLYLYLVLHNVCLLSPNKCAHTHAQLAFYFV